MSRDDFSQPVRPDNLPGGSTRRPRGGARPDPDAVEQAPAAAPAPENRGDADVPPVSAPPPPTAPQALPVPAPPEPVSAVPAGGAGYGMRAPRMAAAAMPKAEAQRWRHLLRSTSGRVAARYASTAEAEDEWDAVCAQARAARVPEHMILAALHDAGLPDYLAHPAQQQEQAPPSA